MTLRPILWGLVVVLVLGSVWQFLRALRLGRAPMTTSRLAATAESGDDAAGADRDREAFQEVDHAAFFTPLAKWAAQIPSADRIPEYVSRAFHVAMSGRLSALQVRILKRRGPPVDAPVLLPAHPPRLAALLAARRKPVAPTQPLTGTTPPVPTHAHALDRPVTA